MTLIEIASALEVAGVDVRGWYWYDRDGPDVVVDVGGEIRRIVSLEIEWAEETRQNRRQPDLSKRIVVKLG